MSKTSNQPTKPEHVRKSAIFMRARMCKHQSSCSCCAPQPALASQEQLEALSELRRAEYERPRFSKAAEFSATAYKAPQRGQWLAVDFFASSEKAM